MSDPAKGLPVFHLSQSPSDDKGPPRRIVFDFELGCVIHDASQPGRSIVHFSGNSYEIDAPLEEAVDELLAVTVSVTLPPGAGAPVDIHQGEQPAPVGDPPVPAAGESQQGETQQEQGGA